MISIRTYLLLTSLLLSLYIHSQSVNYYWKNYDLRHGLSSPSTNCSFQDSDGNLWIGTRDGLNRFDGSRFDQFSYRSNDTGGIADDRIWAIAQDNSGAIICGTSEGVSLIDPGTATITNYIIDIDGIDPDKLKLVRAILVWPDNEIWLATISGIVSWKQGDFKLINDEIKFPVNSDQIFVANKDTSECWIASLNGVWNYSKNKNSFSRIKSSFERFELYDERSIDGLCRDNDNNLWYSSLSDTAIYFINTSDYTEKEFKQFFYNSNNQALRFYTDYLFCDRYNQVWFSAWRLPLRIIDGSEGKEIPFNQINQTDLKLNATKISHINELKNGELVICHDNGFSIHNDLLNLLELLDDQYSVNPTSKLIVNLATTNDSTLLIATRTDGLIRYSLGSNKSEKIELRNDQGRLYLNSIAEFNDEIYCATDNGLYAVDQQLNYTKLELPGLDHLNNKTIDAIFIDNLQNLWITSYGLPTECFSLKNQTPIQLNDTALFRMTNTSGAIRKMLYDSKGSMWAIGNEGICILKNGAENWEKFDLKVGQTGYFQSSSINNIIVDLKGNIWFSSPSGLGKVSPDYTEFKVFTEENGLISDYCHVLGNDAENNIWIGSPKGLFYFDNSEEKFNLLHTDQLITPNDFYMTGIHDSDGNLLLASYKNILKLNNSYLTDFYKISPPVVSLLIVDSLEQPVLSQSLILSKLQNYFSLYFSSPSDAYRDDIIYEYMLEGFDKTWIQASDRKFVAYNDVPGGTYRFKVRARVGGGAWVNSAKDVQIQIQKKFSETILAKLIGIVIILSILGGSLLYFRRRAANKYRKKLLNQLIYNDESLTEEETARFAALIIGSISGIKSCRIFTNSDNIKDEFKKIADNTKSSDQFPDSFHCANLEQDVLNYCINTFTNCDFFLLRDEKEIIGLILCEPHNHKHLNKYDHELLLDVSKILEGRISNARNDAAIKEKEDMLAQINSLLAESQLVSLRAQMNPHFVFNCLNSIQESIVMKQYAEAGMYLNKFSKLFRKILQNSTKNLISLAEEIEVLQLYLQLEHMRFQESFDFEINYDDELDPEELNIPSMLLQPFVENALWHGLMHKDGSRKISIRFYPKNEEIFICEIEDNGIGRAKAAEIKKQKSASTKHESKGIAISIDRLNLINKKQESHASVEIIDLFDNEGNASGTKVIFELSSFL